MRDLPKRPRVLRGITTLAWIGLVALLIGRFLLLTADVPPRFAPSDIGLHVDEGYKTLDARNRIEFGRPRWNPHDDYPGWSARSPITQWLYFTAFSIGGVNLQSARVVGVLFFAALLSAFVMSFYGRYPWWAVTTGAVLLVTQPVLFHYSRTALFEVPLALVVVLALLTVFRTNERRRLLQVAILVVIAVLGARFVKPSVLLYMAPAAIALIILDQISRPLALRTRLIAAVATVLIGAILVYAFHEAIMKRLGLANPSIFIHRFMTNAAQDWFPLTLAAAFLCLLHGIAARPRDYLLDGYRLALAAIITVAPLLIANFPYAPLRYFVPLVPVTILLVVDYFARRSWSRPSNEAAPPWSRPLIGIISVLCAWYVLRSLDYVVLKRLPASIGDDPGVFASTMYRFFAPFALVAFACGFLLESRIGRSRAIPAVVFGLLALDVGLGVFEQVRSLRSPSFAGNEIRKMIVSVTASDACIAGDWAPVLTLGTGRKTLYVSGPFNRPERFPTLQPDYFLSTGSDQDRGYLDFLQNMDGLAVGPPDTLGFMLDSHLTLHELRFETADADSSASRR